MVARTTTHASAVDPRGSRNTTRPRHDHAVYDCVWPTVGYLERTNRKPAGAIFNMPFMIRDDLGDLVQAYANWLEHTQRCMFSTIANYLVCVKASLRGAPDLPVSLCTTTILVL